MATSTSRLAYNDCFDVLDEALANKKGIRVEVPDWNTGNYYRLRLHSARAIDRKDNKETYPDDHKLYGRSIYDQLVVRLREEGKKWWMYIERFSTENLNIEPLGEENVIEQSPNGDLRKAGGAGESQPRSEAREEEITIFDGEPEKEAEAAPTRRKL